MTFLDKLERNFGRFAIPGITRILIVGQVLAWFALIRQVVEPTDLILVPAAVIHGQWWRLVSFIFLPPLSSLGGIQGTLFAAFGWWIFYLLGTSLEGTWGAFRYNVFLLLGYIFTVGAGFLFPFSVATNTFMAGSVFLAFAYLNPTFELSLFLVIPVQIRWLALVAWVFYGIAFLRGDWAERLQVVASVANFLVFFGPDSWRRAGLRTRQIKREATRVAAASPLGTPRHRCRICGKTDRTDPQLDFRYCSKCAGDQCYCPEHIFNHVHVTEENEGKQTG